MHLSSIRPGLLLFSLLFIAPATCLSWPAKVVSVMDGDSLKALRDGRQVEIRLFGIDAPEKGQEYGQKAKELTSALVAGRNIEVEQKDVDSYGRIVALVKVDGQNLNELIVRNGFAWVYRHHCTARFCTDWIKSEMVARNEKKGMWADPNIVPPWEWRQQQRERPEEKTAPRLVLGGDKAAGTPSAAGRYRCDGRTHCSQMTSCEEATYFLRNCPGTKMDGNNDGVPCERQWCN